MAHTHPSGRPIVPNESAPVFQEVAEVDTYSRFNLLPRWTSHIPWMNEIKQNDFEVLMVLSEPGKIKLLSWEPDGPRLVRLYSDLSQNDSSEETLETLRLVQDRYGRLLIDKEHRPYLGDAALAHLGLPLHRGIKSTVYVAVYSQYIAIMSPEYRNKALLGGSKILDDFPT